MAQLSSKESRLVVEYLLATKNEIEIDKRAYDFFHKPPKKFGGMPRPTKWLPLVTRLPWLFGILCKGMLFVWRWGGGVLFNTAEFFRFWRYARSCAAPATQISAENYGLGFSLRAFDVVNSAAQPGDSFLWVTVPWARPVSSPQVRAQIDVFSLLNVHDLLRSFVLANVATSRLAKGCDTKGWALQGYTAFRWFAVRQALGKLTGVFWTAEHFDRWAVLADALVASQKREGMGSSLALVQHGAVQAHGFGVGQHRNSFPYSLRYRLKAVDSLNVYDEANEHVFRSHILALHPQGPGPKVSYFKPQLSLTALAADGVLSVLFVGHPVCEDLHLYLLTRLAGLGEIRFFYKPHPTAGVSAKARSAGWGFIDDAAVFPKVDWLISYPSTLVTEYDSKGIPAFVHAIDLLPKDADVFLSRVQEALLSGRSRAEAIDDR